jgi:hypothetical protein
MLRPGSHQITKERVLAYGPYGSGKSNGWASIRKWYEMTETPGHFHIISTEWEMAHRTAEGYLDGTPGNNFFSNATIHEAWDYETLVVENEKVRGVLGPDDWAVADSIGNYWLWTQDHYCQQNFGKDFKEFMAEGGKVREINWQVVNAMYRKLVLPLIVRNPAHFYACAQADPVQTEGSWADSKEVREMFGRFGAKPVGQKQLGYQFHTVLLMKPAGPGEWTFTTVDDPSREKVVSAPMMDFVMSYLCPIAGWEMA